jgi:hypothetical protein
MPTMVGATMSSILRSNSVTRACFLDVLGHGRFTNEKSGFSAHSFSLVRPANPMRMARI